MTTHNSELVAARRRRRRIAAGRSGGMFEMVEDGGVYEYQYAAPNSEPYRRESILAWESIHSWEPPANDGSVVGPCPNKTSSSDVHGVHPEGNLSQSPRDSHDGSVVGPCPNKTSSSDVHGVHPEGSRSQSPRDSHNDLSRILTKTTEIPLALKEPDSTRVETKSTKSNRASRAFKKMNARVSEFVHHKAANKDKKEDIAIEEATGNCLPRTPIRGMHESQPDSPFKEQMSLEADEINHEEVNKEFFTPPRTNDPDTNSPDGSDADVFD